MRIEAIEVREIRLPLRERFEISSGYSEERRILLVKVDAGGETGWAECVAGEDPGYSYETTETAWHILSAFLVPALLGSEVEGPAEVERRLARVRGHPMAKACLEMAAWDLEARRRGLSLAETLGGSGAPVPVGVSVGLQRTDDLLVGKVGDFLAAGYRKIKLKIKPGRDVEMVRAVREAFPDAPLMVDANSAYTLDDRARLAELDDLDLLMIEQPLAHDDLHEHARLQEALRTPVCLDESIHSAGDAELALALGSCRIINIKPGRVGGFGSSRRIHDLCRVRGVPVWCGGMLESGVGRAYNIALATLPGFTIPGDISASRRYWERDIVDPEFVVRDGMMTPPAGPGIGVTPDQRRIRELTVRVERWSRKRGRPAADSRDRSANRA